MDLDSTTRTAGQLSKAGAPSGVFGLKAFVFKLGMVSIQVMNNRLKLRSTELYMRPKGDAL